MRLPNCSGNKKLIQLDPNKSTLQTTTIERYYIRHLKRKKEYTSNVIIMNYKSLTECSLKLYSSSFDEVEKNSFNLKYFKDNHSCLFNSFYYYQQAPYILARPTQIGNISIILGRSQRLIHIIFSMLILKPSGTYKRIIIK